MPFVYVAPNVTFHGGDSAVTDVFAGLGLAEVIPCNPEANPLSEAWEGQEQVCAVVAASVVGSEECFGKLWVQGLQCQEGVLDYGRNSKPVLRAFFEEVDEGSCLSKGENELIKKFMILCVEPFHHTRCASMGCRAQAPFSLGRALHFVHAPFSHVTVSAAFA